MLAVCLVLLQSASQPARVYDGRLRQIDVQLPRVEATITIDVLLDEAGWRDAARLTGFTQYRPVHRRPAADSTEVLTFYTADDIYFGIRAYQAHGDGVRAKMANRDNIDANDKS